MSQSCFWAGTKLGMSLETRALGSSAGGGAWCLQVELEMAIDTLNPNYCRSKGEQIALNVDGACTDETSTYSS